MWRGGCVEILIAIRVPSTATLAIRMYRRECNFWLGISRGFGSLAVLGSDRLSSDFAQILSLWEPPFRNVRGELRSFSARLKFRISGEISDKPEDVLSTAQRNLNADIQWMTAQTPQPKVRTIRRQIKATANLSSGVLTTRS